jgi:hypothetical protein
MKTLLVLLLRPRCRSGSRRLERGRELELRYLRDSPQRSVVSVVRGSVVYIDSTASVIVCNSAVVLVYRAMK